MPILTDRGWKLTYDDYVKIPDDGRRHEIIDGEHIVNPAPIPRHQAVSGKLYLALAELAKAGRAQVFYSPIDVHLSETDIVQPDLIAIATKHEHRVGQVKIEGPPELVVEILSPSTKHLDRGAKRDLYERSGVLEYWVVDTKKKAITQHVLVDGCYRERLVTEGVVNSTAFLGFEVDIGSIW